MRSHMLAGNWTAVCMGHERHARRHARGPGEGTRGAPLRRLAVEEDHGPILLEEAHALHHHRPARETSLRVPLACGTAPISGRTPLIAVDHKMATRLPRHLGSTFTFSVLEYSSESMESS